MLTLIEAQEKARTEAARELALYLKRIDDAYLVAQLLCANGVPCRVKEWWPSRIELFDVDKAVLPKVYAAVGRLVVTWKEIRKPPTARSDGEIRITLKPADERLSSTLVITYLTTLPRKPGPAQKCKVVRRRVTRTEYSLECEK